MPEWIQWAVNLLVVSGIGLIGYLAKRMLNQIDKKLEALEKQQTERQAETERKIIGELERFRAEDDKRHGKTEERMSKVEDRLNKTLQELPALYVMREDWLRTSSAIDRKLDKITDILIRGGKASD